MNRFIPTIDRKIAVAVLAAGSGTRFGGGKLDTVLAGRPVGQWVTDTIEGAGFQRRLIVVGQEVPDFAAELKGWERVVNYSATDGIASSIRLAALEADQSTRLLLVLADMPLVEREHLLALACARGIAFTKYMNGQYGVPAGFPARCFASLTKLTGDMGAVAASWNEEITYIPPNSEESLRDVDTRSDMDAVQKLVEKN